MLAIPLVTTEGKVCLESPLIIIDRSFGIHTGETNNRVDNRDDNRDASRDDNRDNNRVADQSCTVARSKADSRIHDPAAEVIDVPVVLVANSRKAVRDSSKQIAALIDTAAAAATTDNAERGVRSHSGRLTQLAKEDDLAGVLSLESGDGKVASVGIEAGTELGIESFARSISMSQEYR